MRVVLAGRRQCDTVEREARSEHRGEPGEPLRERVIRRRIRDRARVGRMSVRGLEGEQLPA